MRSRSPARWIAPLALLVAIAAILLVISSADKSGTSSTGDTTTAGITGSTTTGTATTTTTSTGGRRFYTVKPGDVLTAIADKTGVPLEQIERLNPNVDAQTLQTGQRLKLRP